MTVRGRDIDGVDDQGRGRTARERVADRQDARGAQAQGAKVEQRTAPPPLWALGVVAIILGAILWLIGARYTLEGWVNALNIGLELTRLPARIPTPTGWWWALALPLGIVYSVAEVAIPFGPPRSWNALPAWILMIIALGVVHGSDVGSTLLGYTTPGPNPWPMHAWALTSGLWALFAWSVILTYLPERLMLSGWLWVWRGIRRR